MSRRVFEILIILFVVLGAMEFLKVYFLPFNQIKYIQLAGIGIVFLIVIIEYVYNREKRFHPFFGKEIFLILLSVILSMFTAYSGHGQSFAITFIAQRFMYFYIFYFLLHVLRVQPGDVENFIVIFGIAISILYLLQYVIYPRVIFDVRIAKERGTLRIFLPGVSFVIMNFFIALVKFFKQYEIKWLGLVFLSLMIIIFLGTRQIIFSVMLITIIYLLTSKQIKSKILLIPIGFLALIPIFFLFENIINELLNLSERQGTGSDEVQRVKTITFFLTEFYPNKMAYFIGNGVDSQNSDYGVEIQRLRIDGNYYLSDIGIIGNYIRYGVLFLFSVFSILIKVFKYKLSDNLFYIKLYFSMIALLLVTGGDFGDVFSYVPLLMLLYLIDVDLYESTANKLNVKTQDNG
jgi:hypothetical protein